MQLGASRSAFTGKLIAFRSTPVAPVSMRTAVVSVEAGRRCDLTGTASCAAVQQDPLEQPVQFWAHGRDSCSSTSRQEVQLLTVDGLVCSQHTTMGDGSRPAVCHTIQQSIHPVRKQGSKQRCAAG
jgi:hypothetical protein